MHRVIHRAILLFATALCAVGAANAATSLGASSSGGATVGVIIPAVTIVDITPVSTSGQLAIAVFHSTPGTIVVRTGTGGSGTDILRVSLAGPRHNDVAMVKAGPGGWTTIRDGAEPGPRTVATTAISSRSDATYEIWQF